MLNAILASALTPMEKQVSFEVCLGKANKNIAGDFYVSQRTIEAHRANAFQKLRVRNALELAQVLGLDPDHIDYERQTGPVWFCSSSIPSMSCCLDRCASSVGLT